MDAQGLLRQYLEQGRVMQVATVRDGKPWIVTVYFVADRAMNLYWLSLPTRRHSREIMEDNRVAVAIAIRQDLPVIGVQAEGYVEVITHAGTVRGIMERYIGKYDAGHDFHDNFVQGKAMHRMYRFTPERFSLFDEVHFPKDSPLEVSRKI